MPSLSVRDIRWWQWMLVGGIVGAVLALLQTSVPEVPARNLSQTDFETLMEQDGSASSQPLLKDLRVTEVVDAKKPYVVSGLRYVMKNQTKGVYMPFRFQSGVPYKPMDPDVHLPPNDATVMDFMDAARQLNPSLSFTNAWWNSPSMVWLIYLGGGMALLGGAWPMAIRLIAGPPKELKKAEYDLNQFKPEPVPETPRPRTFDDDQLGEVIAQLTDSFQVQNGINTADTTIDPKEPATVPQLSGGHEPTAIVPKPETNNHYAGEFYPTVTHAKPRKT